MAQTRLIDHNAWCRATEGPFSRLCKLASINVLGAKHICSDIFDAPFPTTEDAAGRKRTLLQGDWAGHCQDELAQDLRRMMLDAVCGYWASKIATDEHVRYCPRCLEAGYHSVAHQIVGIVECPAHRSPILSTCRRCGTPTPPYAVSSSGFDRDFLCVACYAPLWPEWTINKLFEAHKAALDERPFQEILNWLSRLGKMQFRWNDHPLWGLPTGRTQTAAFAIVDRLIPFPIHPVQAPVFIRAGRAQEIGQTLLPSMDCSLMVKRLPIYKSIRRHIKHQMRQAYRGRAWRQLCMKGKEWISLAPVEATKESSALAHAWSVWRLRCEKVSRLDALCLSGKEDTGLHLRVSTWSWPYEVRVDDGVWASFLWEAFRADLATAREWESRLAEIRTGLGKATHRRSVEALIHEAYGAFTQRFNLDEAAWPVSITWLTVQNAAGEQVYLVSG